MTPTVLVGAVCPEGRSKTIMARHKPRKLPDLPSLDDVYRNYTLRVLAVFDGDRVAAAKALGISRATLSKWLARWQTTDSPDKRRADR